MIHKVEAIVLRSMDYQETSKILTLFTREFGSLGVIVKGARKNRNKFGASLEPLAHITAVIYKKETRDLQLLTDADLIASFPQIQKDFEKLFLSLSILELVYIVTRHREQNELLFDLLVGTLEVIEHATKSIVLLFYYFETRLIWLLGFQPSLDECILCHRKIHRLISDGVYRVIFDYSRGSFQCGLCYSVSHSDDPIDMRVMALWEQLGRLGVKEIQDITWDREMQGSLDRLITTYFQHHQPDMKTLQAKKMYDSMREW
jgi:DNA repair protein RecO (recombination protein O)